MGAINLSKQTINLTKKEVVNLSKSAADGLNKIRIALGWDMATASGGGFLSKLFSALAGTADLDLDAWFVAFDKSNDIKKLVYYNDKGWSDGTGKEIALHHGDNLVGGSTDYSGQKKDDETITMRLENVPSYVDRIVIAVTIYQGVERFQSFDSVRNFYIRIVDERDGFEICRFTNSNTAEDPGSITFVVGELHKNSLGEWEFKAEGYGTKDKSIAVAVKRLADKR